MRSSTLKGSLKPKIVLIYFACCWLCLIPGFIYKSNVKHENLHFFNQPTVLISCPIFREILAAPQWLKMELIDMLWLVLLALESPHVRVLIHLCLPGMMGRQTSSSKNRTNRYVVIGATSLHMCRVLSIYVCQV